MKKEEVLVSYIYEGKVGQRDMERGVAISNNRVFVDGESGPAIYEYSRVADSNLVTVNLDENDTDYLCGDYNLVDIVIGVNRKPAEKHVEYYKKKKAADKDKMTQARQNRLFKYKLALREHLPKKEWLAC